MDVGPGEVELVGEHRYRLFRYAPQLGLQGVQYRQQRTALIPMAGHNRPDRVFDRHVTPADRH